MESINEILAKFDVLVLLIVRATELIGVLIICLLITRQHIKSFGGTKRKRPNVNKGDDE
jgi:hypothetical protein